MSTTMSDYDYTFKVLVLGDESVGKSSLIRRFHLNDFDRQIPMTIGVDFFIHDLDVGGKKVKLRLWDTAGEERQYGLTSCYYRGAQGALIVFSLSSRKSFENIQTHWLEEFYQKSGGSGTIVVLVGNKCDLEEEREVEEDDIREFAELHSMYYLETSAKDCTNVKEAFETIAYKLCESHEQYLSFSSMGSDGPSSFTLHGAYGVPGQTTEGPCCDCTSTS